MKTVLAAAAFTLASGLTPQIQTIKAAHKLNGAAAALDDGVIASINAQSPGWTAGRNDRFEGMTIAQVQKMMGTWVDKPKPAFAVEGKPAPMPVGWTAPASFDVRTQWPACSNLTSHIRDQSDCGCCWAFGTTEAFNDRLCILNGYKGPMLSPQDTCSCCNENHGCSSGGCDGGFLEDSWSYFTKTGVVTGGDYGDVGTCEAYQLPWCSHHEPGKYPGCPTQEYSTPACPVDIGKGCADPTYTKAWAADKSFAKSGYNLNSVAEIQNDLVTRGSVSCAFTVYADFLTYKNGTYHHTTGASLGGHAIKFVGWGTDAAGVDYWTVLNSWNSGWGNAGSFNIRRGNDECGIESGCVAGEV